MNEDLAWALDANGMPVGVQVVGQAADDAGLLRLSAQIESAHPWADWRPPIS